MNGRLHAEVAELLRNERKEGQKESDFAIIFAKAMMIKEGYVGRGKATSFAKATEDEERQKEERSMLKR